MFRTASRCISVVLLAALPVWAVEDACTTGDPSTLLQTKVKTTPQLDLVPLDLADEGQHGEEEDDDKEEGSVHKRTRANDLDSQLPAPVTANDLDQDDHTKRNLGWECDVKGTKGVWMVDLDNHYGMSCVTFRQFAQPSHGVCTRSECEWFCQCFTDVTVEHCGNRCNRDIPFSELVQCQSLAQEICQDIGAGGCFHKIVMAHGKFDHANETVNMPCGADGRFNYTKEPMAPPTMEPMTPTMAPMEPVLPPMEPVPWAPTMAPLEPVVPMDPLAPTMAPMEPLLPMDPLAPTMAPLEPEVPMDPLAPTMAPLEPEVPMDLLAPTMEPMTPTMAPREPVLPPMEPVPWVPTMAPLEPVVPMDPLAPTMVPLEPVVPMDPLAPTMEPVVPMDPLAPTMAPMLPMEPIAPTPMQPMAPTEPMASNATMVLQAQQRLTSGPSFLELHSRRAVGISLADRQSTKLDASLGAKCGD